MAIDNLNATTTSSPVTVTVGSSTGALPTPWVDQDIGSVALFGTATYSGGTFTVKGAGSDIQSTADQFHFVYQPLNGDGTIVARVASVQKTHVWAKGGVMIRESLAANSRNAFMLVSASSGASFQFRASTGGGTTASNASGILPPYWVRLIRTGNTLAGSISPDGITWTPVGSATINMGASIYVGLAVTSHNSSVLCTSTFDNVTFTPSSPDSPPSVAITSPSSAVSFTAPATIPITATASDTDGTVVRVDFYSGSTLLGSSSTAPYSYTWSNVPRRGLQPDCRCDRR